MSRTVVVTPAQVDAARAVVDWSREAGQDAPDSVKRIASAAVQRTTPEFFAPDSERSVAAAIAVAAVGIVGSDPSGSPRSSDGASESGPGLDPELLRLIQAPAAVEMEAARGALDATAPQRSDLYVLRGIGDTQTKVLQSIGVDSIKELSHRNPASLTKMIADRHGKVVGLSEAIVAGWIAEAKSRRAE